MKVAFDISSTQSGHQYRGIGFYTKALHQELANYARGHKDFSLIPFMWHNYSALPDADVYHFPAFSPFFWSIPILKIKQCIFTIHDLIPLQYPTHYPAGLKGTLKWNLQKLILPYAKHILTDSVASKKMITQLTRIPEAKVTPVYLAASEDYRIIETMSVLTTVRKKYKLPEKYILYVGDLNWHKNIVRLAKICIKLNYPLVVAGKQAVNSDIDVLHPWNAELAQFQMVANDHPNQIIRLGFIPIQDLVAVFNMATALVSVSYAEGFGLPIIEAMACGCPVITSNCSSLAEIAGDSALLVDPHESNNIMQVMTNVWENNQLRSQLSQKGLQRSKEFRWDITGEKTVQVYKKVNCY